METALFAFDRDDLGKCLIYLLKSLGDFSDAAMQAMAAQGLPYFPFLVTCLNTCVSSGVTSSGTGAK